MIETSLLSEWRPLHDALATLHRIGREQGDDVLVRMGSAATVVLPAGMQTIEHALRSLDAIYQASHRKHGSFVAGGIGCYVCTDDTDRQFVIDSASLYPCAFDRGFISAIARRFEPGATVQHLEGERCRRLGSLTCAYEIRW